jgi:hypothetical protein
MLVYERRVVRIEVIGKIVVTTAHATYVRNAQLSPKGPFTTNQGFRYSRKFPILFTAQSWNWNSSSQEDMASGSGQERVRRYPLI